VIVSIFDYGAGNIHSLFKALEREGIELRVDTDPLRAIEAEALVLPGVGGFAHAAERLAPGRSAMRERIISGLPTLGVCLGMQLFFEGSDEGPGEGLGLARGRVSRIRAERVPQIGWNGLELEVVDDSLFPPGSLDIAYFANSFVCRDASRHAGSVIAWTTHERDRFPSAIRVGSAVGVQFHPEKSSRAGVEWIQRWLDEAVSGEPAAAGGR